MLQKKRLTKEQAIQKLKHFCSYQERSHSEVKEKLYSFGLWKTDVESVIAQLIEEDYLNEERFARLFAGGKFRMKQWGRVKIRYELKQKGISEYCIKKGIQEIEDDKYLASLEKLSAAKWALLKTEKSIFTKKRKAIDYLLAKGYERDLALQSVNNVAGKEDGA